MNAIFLCIAVAVFTITCTTFVHADEHNHIVSLSLPGQYCIKNMALPTFFKSYMFIFSNFCAPPKTAFVFHSDNRFMFCTADMYCDCVIGSTICLICLHLLPVT